MKKFEYWAYVIITFIIIVIIFQWALNTMLPLFGIPEVNILQALGIMLLLYITTMWISLAWNAGKDTKH